MTDEHAQQQQQQQQPYVDKYLDVQVVALVEAVGVEDGVQLAVVVPLFAVLSRDNVT